MYDRSVQFAQRYQLKKVEGTDDIFDLIPAPGIVNNEGTLINKAALLKDVTAALFGLTTDAVPDDVFKILSRFQSGLGNEYLWAKSKIGWAIVEDDYVYSNVTSDPYSCSKNVTISESGVISLDSPSDIAWNLIPDGYYIDYDKSGSIGKIVSGYGSTTRYFHHLSTEKEEVVEQYLNSPDSDAYPPREPDGYTYTPLGQLGSKVRIETGSYIGTGTYGISNPTRIMFNFTPKIVILFNCYLNSGMKAPMILFYPDTTQYFAEGTAGGMAVTIKWGKTLEFYADTAKTQFNVSRTTTQYIAIA